MPQFMDVHDGFVGATQDQINEAHKKDVQFQSAEGVKFTRWWADPASGKVFCLSEGPSKEAVQRVHQKAGHPADQIYEVRLSGQ
jgi:Nickel responsive protein SCO4226-like